MVPCSRPPKKVPLTPDYENSIYNEKVYDYILGVDEAGRGCLAGPVVACSCYIPIHLASLIPNIRDSKQLSIIEREKICSDILEHDDILFQVSQKSVEYIDETDILSATLEAMTLCIELLLNKICCNQSKLFIKILTIIDGNKVPTSLRNPFIRKINNISVEMECQSVVKGDSSIFSIATASILAKVHRDRIMHVYNIEYPSYGFQNHKGYATLSHIQSIHKFGLTPIHRLTFRPINSMLLSGQLEWPHSRGKVEIDSTTRAQLRKKKNNAQQKLC